MESSFFLTASTLRANALCFSSSSVIFLLVDARVGLNWLLVSFLSHVNKKHHSFIHSFIYKNIIFRSLIANVLTHNAVTACFMLLRIVESVIKRRLLL